jgi:SpoVK/Ycf46/Vps4 family AAA+-type ATPase
VATANDVRSLPQELLRSGRFDDLFFVDLPVPEERREIIHIYLSRTFKGQQVDPSLLDRMVELSDGFSGSDIAAACKEIGEEAVRNGVPPRFPDHFAIEAFQNVVPLSRSAPERIEELRRLSDRALPASGAPRADHISTQQFGRRVVLQ